MATGGQQRTNCNGIDASNDLCNNDVCYMPEKNMGNIRSMVWIAARWRNVW